MGRRDWQGGQPPVPSSRGSQPTPPSKGDRRNWRFGSKDAGVDPATSRKARRFFFGAFSLAVVVGLALVVASVIIPAPPPVLRILTAAQAAAPIPFNAFATRDAVMLAGQNKKGLVTTLAGEEKPADLDEMERRLDKMRTIAPRRVFFPWETTTAIVYVNALGVSLWDPDGKAYVPCLIPEGATIASSKQLLPAKRILDAVAHSSATYKLVVFDCQKVECLWPMGLLANRFVEDVKREHEQGGDGYKNLFLLFSCSQGESAYAGPEKGTSPFAFYFAQALAGDSREAKSKRVTLKGLTDQVKKEVRRWSLLHRTHPQTPELVTPLGTDPAKIELVDAGDPMSKFVAPDPSTPIDKNKEEQLQKGWTAFYQRLRDKEGSTTDVERMAAALLRADSYWRAGEASLLETQLRNLELPNHERSLAGLEGYSLPMAEYIGAEKKDVEKKIRELRRKLDGALKGTAADFDIPLAGSGAVPIEAHFTRILKDEYLNRGVPDALTKAKSALALRISAEQAAVPIVAGGRDFVPIAALWVRPSIEQADGRRRLYEDLLLAQQNETVPLGARAPLMDADAYQQSQRRYQSADKSAKILAQAYALRAELLLELPYLSVLASRPIGIGADRQNRLQFYSQINEQLLPQTGALFAELNVVPSLSLASTEESAVLLDRRVKQIEESAKPVKEVRDQLMKSLRDKALTLVGTTGAPTSQSEWRQIDDVLSLPFPTQPENAKKSAQDRWTLLQRVRQNVKSSDAQTTSESLDAAGRPDPVRTAAQRERSFQLALKLFSLDGGQKVDCQADVAGCWEDAVRGAWTRLQPRASTPPERSFDLSPLLVEEGQERLRAAFTDGSQDSKARKEFTRRGVDALFLTQASRCVEDFWGRACVGTNEPYFQKAAGAYLDWCRKNNDAAFKADKFFIGLNTRLNDLAALNAEAGAMKETSLTGYDMRRVPLSLAVKRQDFPPGWAALRMKSPPQVRAQFALEPTPPIGAEEGKFDVGLFLTRTTETPKSSPDFAVEPDLFYRGHKFAWRIPIRLADESLAPATYYVNDLTGNPKIRVALKAEEKSNAAILFVVDCSGSMRPANGNFTRMEPATDALRKFGAFIPDGALRVGMRVFAAKEESGDENAGRTDSELLMDIDVFDKKKFIGLVKTLDAKGNFTPLFYAVEKAIDDVKDKPGSKNIILISDGDDSWAKDPAKIDAEIERLRRRCEGVDVTIHTLGWEISGPGSTLDKIASKIGAHPGKCIDLDGLVSKGNYDKEKKQEVWQEKLLEEITGLSGIFSYQVKPPGKATFGEKLPLYAGGELADFGPPGQYEILVADWSGNRLQKKFFAGTGEEHRFIYHRGSELLYESDAGSIAKKSGADGVQVEVFTARTVDFEKVKGRPSGLELSLSVFKEDNDDGWRPSLLKVQLTPNPTKPGAERTYFCYAPAPNEGGFHGPRWRIIAENWPKEAKSVLLEVAWPTEGAGDEQAVEWTKWSQGFKGQSNSYRLPQELSKSTAELTRWKLSPDSKGLVRLTVVDSDRRRCDAWSVAWPTEFEISSSRQAYDREHGFMNADFSFRKEAFPKEVTLRRAQSKSPPVKFEIPIGAQGI